MIVFLLCSNFSERDGRTGEADEDTVVAAPVTVDDGKIVFSELKCNR